MANGVRIEIDHDALEAIEDSYSGAALELADEVKRKADRMRGFGAAEYNVNLRPGRKRGRHYAVVSADAPSTAADNARNNTLAKAL